MLAQKILAATEGASWTRDMFMKGQKLVAEYGEDHVFDFSIGNPVFEPPREFVQAMREVVGTAGAGMHRYMPSNGIESTREFIAETLRKRHNHPFLASDITLSVGAGGGLNVVLKALCEPGDEVVVFSPFFFEYKHYADNHQAKLVVVPTTNQFRLDMEALTKALSPRTRVVIINSPNNPTGVVYSREELKSLGDILRKASSVRRDPIVLLSDEPYARLTFDGIEVPSIFDCYEHGILVTSFSKDLAIPGERIGYIALSPAFKDRELVTKGFNFCMRALGFVNAPAFMQRVIPRAGDCCVDMDIYRRNRDLLWEHLSGLGFECIKPEGAFYLFPRSPIEDDVSFVGKAVDLRLLMVPGTGFGCPGHFRISFCFATEKIERSLPIFSELAEIYGLK